MFREVHVTLGVIDSGVCPGANEATTWPLLLPSPQFPGYLEFKELLKFMYLRVELVPSGANIGSKAPPTPDPCNGAHINPTRGLIEEPKVLKSLNLEFLNQQSKTTPAVRLLLGIEGNTPPIKLSVRWSCLSLGRFSRSEDLNSKFLFPPSHI